MVGRTGCGKTTAALALLPLRSHAVFLSTKPSGKDSTVRELHAAGWHRMERWDPNEALLRRRVVLEPRYRTMADKPAQAAALREALASIFTMGGWCVAADETYHLSRNLRLDGELRDLWMQGRSLGVTLLAGTQRPVHVPVEMWTQASYSLVWRMTDRRDVDHLKEAGASPDALKRLVQQLDRYECVVVRQTTGEMIRTTPPPPSTT